MSGSNPLPSQAINSGSIDRKNILFHYKSLAESGDVGAMTALGSMYEQGFDTQTDHDLAVYWYDLASQNGENSISAYLGSMFYHGTNVDVDYAKAFMYLKRAPQDAQALYLLGEVNREGKSVQADLAIALVYYMDSAEKLNSDAMYRIG